ncbi:MAG TPA: hypothetical protein VMP68_08180 [Candidatus Eisenbacteria bacterium]|nr:hypothetical protein [Candidatus Eisenbacteria bacterium]
MAKFDVTYEITTPESAESGDYEELGYIAEGVSFREAVDLVKSTRTSLCDGIMCIVASDSRIDQARWITVYNGMEFETGAHESRNLHIPDHITAASRRRIMRIVESF